MSISNISSDTKSWLTLKQAAERLGVHASTLRRWTDNDEIPYLITPGGHRRFLLEQVDQFAAEKQRLRQVGNLEQIWGQQALSHTRQEMAGQADKPWLAGMSIEHRQQSRLLGQRLMGLTLQFVSTATENPLILDEARNIGQQYAQSAKQLGLSMAQVLEATQFFRDTLIEAALQLPERVHVQHETNLQLMRRINTLLNTVQLAVADAYETQDITQY